MNDCLKSDMERISFLEKSIDLFVSIISFKQMRKLKTQS